MIKVCSDFSGIGAFDCALKRLGIPHRNLYACDMDKFVKQAWHANHECENWYTNVYDRPIPTEPVDIYMTSPPCQAFSMAGKRQGEQDDRGVLFWNSLDFIRTNKPKTFIFENVKGLMSVENGSVFKTWIDHLGGGCVNGTPHTLLAETDSVPYDIWHFVLNSKNFGVAQSRERVFIVGIRTDIKGKFVVPTPTDTTKRLRDFLEPVKQIPEKYFLSDCRLKGLEKAHQFNKNNKYCFKFLPKTRDDISNVILSRDPNTSVDGPFINEYEQGQIRKLTPLECWRLQGYTDTEYEKVKTAPMSDTQLYKQAGNSITVNVLTEIIRNLINAI